MSREVNWLPVTRINDHNMKARYRWLMILKCRLILKCSERTDPTSESTWNTVAKSCSRRIWRSQIRRKRMHTRKITVVLYSHDSSSMEHATASLTITFPRNGICDAPDAYHQILYALSAAKHGTTNADSTLSDLCNK